VLGRIADVESVEILLANVDEDSYGHRLRTAALNALVETGDPRGFDPALRYAAYGHHDHLRTTAIRVVGRWGILKPYRDTARKALIGWLGDPQSGAVHAAIDALAGIDDAESREALARLRGASLSKETRAVLDGALARMDGVADRSRPADRLAEEITTVRDDLAELGEAITEWESHYATVDP